MMRPGYSGRWKMRGLMMWVMGWALQTWAVDIHRLPTSIRPGVSLRPADGEVGLGPTGGPSEAVASQGWEADLLAFREDLRRGRLQRMALLTPIHLATHATDPELNGYVALVRAVNGQPNEARQASKAAEVEAKGRFLARLAESILRRQAGDLPGALAMAREATDLDPRHPYGWNVLGRAWLDSGNRTNALEGFRRAVGLAEDFYPGWLNLGAVTLEAGDVAGARTAFGKAVQLESQAVTPRFGLALALEAAGALSDALGVLQEGDRARPGDPLLLPKLTDLQMRAGRWNEARTNAQRMASQALPGASIALANIALHDGNEAAAAEALGQVDDREPDRHYLEAYRWLSLGRLSEAQQSFEKVLQLAPVHSGASLSVEFVRGVRGEPSRLLSVEPGGWPEAVRPVALFLRACLEVGRTNTADAFRLFTAAEGFLPGFSMAGIEPSDLTRGLPPATGQDLGLGVLLHSKEMPKAARAALDRVMVSAPGSFMGHYWLGVLALTTGDRSQARDQFQAAVAAAPRFFAGLFTAGELLFTSGQPAAAVPLFQRAQAVKADPGLSLRLGLYHEHMAEDAQAEEQYRQVVRLAPDFFAGHNQLAWFLARRGRNLEEALTLARRADELLPGNASILDTLGWIHHLQGRPGPAADHLRRALAANPQNPTIQYHLAVVLHGEGKVAEAREWLEKALSNPTPFPDRDAAKRLLESKR